jgi:putative ABC transport system permease protein
MVKALDRKLLRDLFTLRAQALTIALVVAAGLAGFIGSLSTVDSLDEGRDRYYASDRLADVFSFVRRAPEQLGEAVRELPGVAEIQTSLLFGAQIDVAGVERPLTGRIIGSHPREWTQGLNRLTLRTGRWPEPGSYEVLVSEAFAKARQLTPGSSIHALLNGRRQKLSIVGIALSPEYIFAASTGGPPDDTSFGVFWIDRQPLEAAFQMQGAFNTISLKLRPGASQATAIEQLDRLLEPYGSRGAYGRSEQPSHKAVSQEIREQRVFGILLPSIFLAVAVFVLNVVIDRQVTTQRDQIAALKALGYENRAISLHYLKLAVLVVLLGVLIGAGLGDWLGRYMTHMYSAFFRFPTFYYASSTWTLVAGTMLFLGAGMGGAWLAVRRLVTLAPAEAMRPPSPPVYRPLLIDRLRIGQLARIEIRAPVAGQVLRLAQESETTVALGAPLIEIGDPNSLEAVIEVLSQDALRIAAGMPVRLVASRSSPALLGTVQRVEPSGRTKISTLGVEEQRVNVIVDFSSAQDMPPTLGDGFRIEASIIVMNKAQVPVVPIGALFRNQGQWSVFVAQEGTARLRSVTLDARNQHQAWISKGLSIGETVIVYPPDTVADGVRIKAR